MRKKKNSKIEMNTPKIWLIINSQKHGPFSILEIAIEVGHGNIHLMDQGSYDGNKWQALGDMPEFSSAKKDNLPPRPILNGDPTRIIRIADIIAKDLASPEKKRERSQEKQKRILQTLLLATGCCILVLSLKLYTQSRPVSKIEVEVEKEIKKIEPMSLTSLTPNEEIKPEVVQTLPPTEKESPQEVYQEYSQDETQYTTVEMNARAKEANFTRYPASGESEYSDDVGPISTED